MREVCGVFGVRRLPRFPLRPEFQHRYSLLPPEKRSDGFLRGNEAGIKDGGCAKHPGVEEFKEAPEFAEVILHGRAGEGEAEVGLEESGRLWRIRSGRF